MLRFGACTGDYRIWLGGVPSSALSHAQDGVDKEQLKALDDIVTHQSSLSTDEIVAVISSALASPSARVRGRALWTFSSQVAESRFRQTPDAVERSKAAHIALMPMKSKIIDALRDNAAEVRIAAMAALGNLDYIPGDRVAAVTRTPQTARILAGRLQAEPSPTARSEIVKAFALMDREQVVEGVAETRDAVIGVALGDSDADVVQFGALGVGRQRLSIFLPATVSLLRSSSLKVRMAAAQSISMFGSAALPHITALQAAADRESDPRVKQTLEGALLRLQGVRR